MDTKPTNFVMAIAPVTLAAVVFGCILTLLIVHGHSLPSIPRLPGIDKPLPAPEQAKPVVTEWLSTSDHRTFLGLRDDGSVIWRRTKRAGDVGDLPPVGKPIGDKPPEG